MMFREGVYYVDHSILSTMDACEEKARLSYKEHLVPRDMPVALSFGSAIHAGIAEYYRTRDADLAQVAFYKEAESRLPETSDDGEKRSIKRGSYILEQYIKKWSGGEAQWKDILDANQEPLIEIGGSLYFMDYKGVPVMYVFKIDRVRESRVDSKAYNWETKTTSSSVKVYVNQVKPNHQITGYYWAAKEFLKLDLAGTIFDVVYVSDRKMDGGKYPGGVNPDEDFLRVETRRSDKDIEEFMYDLREGTERYLDLYTSGKIRWRRSAPSACFQYGGCYFRDACNSNLNPQIMSNKYKESAWHPWKS